MITLMIIVIMLIMIRMIILIIILIIIIVVVVVVVVIVDRLQSCQGQPAVVLQQATTRHQLNGYQVPQGNIQYL